MFNRRIAALSACIVMGSAGAAAAEEVYTLFFAPTGGSYLALADATFLDREVTRVRVFLNVQAAAGSNIANFETAIDLPIVPFAGNSEHLEVSGSQLAPMGGGLFSIAYETTAHNGIIRAGRFGAESPSVGFSGQILDGSRVEIVTIPAPAGAALLVLAGITAARRRR